MKFTRSKPIEWHGSKELPMEINTIHNQVNLAEFELLSVLAALHGLTAFDMLTGAMEGSEKDRDINEVLDAFQIYMKPKMPTSNYTSKDVRSKR